MCEWTVGEVVVGLLVLGVCYVVFLHPLFLVMKGE